MDFSKIQLANERSQHVTKRLNRLSTWGFFKVLYRDNLFRLFGFSLLMIVLMVPMFFTIYKGEVNLIALQQNLPLLNDIGFSTGFWSGVSDQYTTSVQAVNNQTVVTTCLYALLLAIMFSGGFAVIRDAFWTGKFSTVGIFPSMWKGLKSSLLYAIVSVAVIAASICGLYFFYTWASVIMPLWLAIVLLVLLCIVDLFVVTYACIVCSVSVTYKQSVARTLDDSWRLLWLNVLPNIIHLVLALLPIPLYFLFTGFLQSFYIVFLLMFGGMYFPLVWQTHMMKTFALFHPVEARKKNGKKSTANTDEVGSLDLATE